MALISKILVPVDFSDRCQDATRYAAALACRFQCELSLLHVFVQPWAAYSSPEGYATPPPYDFDSTYAEVEGHLDDFMKDELGRLNVRRVVSTGDPASHIVEYACSEKCDLIVMPTHGYGPFRRFLLGSVTAKILHDAPCPVFTGPHLEHVPSIESPSFHKVLCALDLCAESRRVLEWASCFASAFASNLTIVHALPISVTRMEGVYFDAQWRSDQIAAARSKLAALQADMPVQGEVLIEVGDVPDAVREAAQQTGADFTVIGRGCSNGILGRLRANTYGIVRESPCPVVAV